MDLHSVRASPRRSLERSRESVPTGMRASAASLAEILRYIVLTIFLIYCILPAIWILAAITKDSGQIFTTFGFWFANPPHFFENVADLFAFRDGIFVRWFGNSLLYAGSISVGSTLICALGGYAFAKYDFPGKHFLFNFILGAIMVPSTALVLPLFLMLYRLGLVNSIWGVILPSLVNPFGLYLMRVFWNASFPNDLIEAGCLEQLLSAFDRSKQRQSLPVNARLEHLEQRQQCRRRRKTVLSPDCSWLAHQRFAAHCSVYPAGEILAWRIDGRSDEVAKERRDRR